MDPKWWILLAVGTYLGYQIKSNERSFNSPWTAIIMGLSFGTSIHFATRIEEKFKLKPLSQIYI